MLELCYNLSTKVCDTDKYEEMKMDSDSLYLAVAERELYNSVRSEKKQKLELSRSKDCSDLFTADASSNSSPRTCCAKLKKQDKREPGLFEEEIWCTELLRLCSPLPIFKLSDTLYEYTTGYHSLS